MKCIFLGYADGEFGYHLWDLVKHKVIRSKDAIFNTLEMFKKLTGDMEVKKYANMIVERQENISSLHENNGKPVENDGQPTKDNGKPIENDGQREEESLQRPLQEVQPKNTPPQLVCRSTTPHEPSEKYPPSNYILLIDEGEPHWFQEACDNEHSKDWKNVMQEETNSLLENKTW